MGPFDFQIDYVFLAIPGSRGKSWKRLTLRSTLMHLGETKMFHDLKKNFWWRNMRREISKFVEECPTFQKVKADSRLLAGEL